MCGVDLDAAAGLQLDADGRTPCRSDRDIWCCNTGAAASLHGDSSVHQTKGLDVDQYDSSAGHWCIPRMRTQDLSRSDEVSSPGARNTVNPFTANNEYS